MKTIVFIGSHKSGTSREAIQIADQMGYFTVLITNNRKFIDQREEFQDVHQMIFMKEIHDIEKLKESFQLLQDQGKNIKACISLIDPYVHLASILSKEMGFVHLSTKALYKMEDKTRFRHALQKLDVNPFYSVMNPNDSVHEMINQIESFLPLILKYPLSNGSKDVIFVKSKEALPKGIEMLKTKFPHLPILIEEYLDGPQYLIEVIVCHGDIHLIGVVEQEFSQKDTFIVTGYSFPAEMDEFLYNKLEMTVKSIINKLEMYHGSCHLEMRNVKGEWKLVEINPRMSGGAMNRIILEGTGVNIVQEIIKMNLGEEPILKGALSNHVFAHFLTVSSRGKLIKVTGKNRALSYDGVKEVYIKPRKGQILTAPYSMGDRYAYVIASSDSKEEAKRIATTAAKEIKFYMEPL
ncbi:ATP-grasp domain-containing protein [Cytobacillus dafuensis]|uniref:ATP-grasp domain-containing protein n=1 Tax=Cytobacillus dafuensis TaxID=1742359 RepID=A0A5B8YZT8_CYTDA|nr:ATP-grasp domain-containing protein [Cytobacillus dafuensis]QED46224.1 ATP-grasp domain-containing protein [Cytobacillus dafuensis]